MDEIPAIEVTNDNMGINAIRTSMDLFNTALAMCGGAHLANLKEYSQKFISMLTQKVAADTGLRTASVLEAQAADRQIWGAIAELVNERKWTFDSALHELTHVRSDLAVLLQLRPKPPKPSTSSTSSSSWQPKGGKAKGRVGENKKVRTPLKAKWRWLQSTAKRMDHPSNYVSIGNMVDAADLTASSRMHAAIQCQMAMHAVRPTRFSSIR